MNILKWTITLVASLFSLLTWAHHGWNSYDETKPRTETGIIRDSGWENPHGFIKLEVGKKLYYIVLAPPSRMEQRGMSKADLKPGTIVTIVGAENRTNPDEIRAEHIIVSGKKTEMKIRS